MGKDFTKSSPATDVKPNWWIVDAKGRKLGRMATHIANVIMGKNRPSYSPERDCGDFVVVINAEKIVLSGKKAEQKEYAMVSRGGKHKGTAWAHGLHVVPFARMIEKFPDRVVRLAVKRMLRNTKRNRQAFKKLKVYKGMEHPHAAQDPKPLGL